MPDYSGRDKGQVPGLLKDKGTAIGSFSQGKFRTDMGVKTGTIHASAGGESLGDGYCAGVTLDWARRVLLSSETRGQEYLAYGFDTMNRGEGTRIKGGAERRSLSQSQERAHDTVGRMGQAWNASNNMNFTGGSAGFKVSAQTWEATAQGLDAAFDASRNAAGRGVSGKRFSSLVLQDSALVTCTADEWVNMVPGCLRVGDVTRFGFGKQDKSGHAVAVWRRSATPTEPNAYYFFDPNFGVFSYNLASLTDVLKILFYRRTLPPHTPYYVECSHTQQQRFSYTIFGRPTGPTGITQAQQPMNAYTSPAQGHVPPGNSATSGPTPVQVPTGLKADLLALLSDQSKLIPEGTPFGTHPNFRGGWVKINYSMKTKLAANNVGKRYLDEIKSAGQQMAIPKSSIDFILEDL